LKRFLLPFVIFVVGISRLVGQDIPLFTQKLTNSFLYNPSVVGNTLGSITLSHRRFWSELPGSPATNFISFHTPLDRHRFGVGANLYQENIGILQTLYGSAAFAYHIRINDNNAFSMGVAAEFNNSSINFLDVDVRDTQDLLLTSDNVGFNKVDFSFGVSYKSKYVKLGASANRLTGFVGSEKNTNQFPQYYSGFLNGTIPLFRDRDLLEPIINYRSLAPGSSQFDLGLYYTYNNIVTLGVGYRSSSIVNATAAVKIYNRFSIGYSSDIYTGAASNSIGTSNEITLRYDFRDQSYFSKAKNSRNIKTSTLAIRRKTLSTYQSKGTAMQKSKRYKKKIKKNYMHSPNYRMDNSRKLQSKQSHKKKSFNSYYKKRKKPRR
jgi:type IX secretion system PorP/SprF family membrane protein